MSTTTIPPSGLTLHGIAQNDHGPKHTSTPAILFQLSDSLLEDVKKASSVQGGLQFVTGGAPKIRLGKRTIDLTISPEAFRHELYAASTESLGDLEFAGVVSHRAELHVPERKQSIGSDAAVAALQSRLASYKQEKEAKSVNISNDVVAEPKNRREAARLLGLYPVSPSIGASSTPRESAAPTSYADNDAAGRTQAMKTPLVHLLATKPQSWEEMMEKTRVPKEDLEEILGRIGKQEQGKWQLTDRAYKELDVWKFAYSSQEQRQAAVDNAIRAYGRLRLSKDDKLWQKLLHEQDRDKGIVLSKLHLATAGGTLAGSPLLQGETADDGNAASTSNTPRLGPSAATPKTTAAKSGGGALSKRLFAKDPKKRAAEENKEKKRKEKEAAAAAASDREVGSKAPPRKKQATKTNNVKVKSAELVHSSSEESEGEIREAGATGGGRQPPTTATANERKRAANAARTRTKAVDSASPNPGDVKVAPPKTAGAGSATPASRSVPSSTTKPAKPSTLGMSTPNALSAPSAQSRSALSPQKSSSRPKVPSPLGAARARVASDVSERGALGVQRVRQGAETPKGLGITGGVRKRHDTVTSTDSHASNRSEKMNGDHGRSTAEKAHKTGVNGTSTPRALANGHLQKESQVVKRKAQDSPNGALSNGHAVKHRKTESTSSNSQKSSIGANSSIGARLERSTSSDSASSSIINDITYSQGVTIAQRFRDDYYPKYARLYDEQAAMERRGETVPREDRDRLWTMHRRLEQMKREIRAASQREHLDE